MARTPHDPVEHLLRRTSLPQHVKADAWDAFHRSPTHHAFTEELKRLPLPQHVRANLWDLKLKHTASKEAKMLPRESKYGRGGTRLPEQAEPARTKEPSAEKAPGSVSAFIAENFRHFNSATFHDAAEDYKKHLAKGVQMLVSLAGAMSTAELGRTLAPMIRQGKVHAVSCTAANLEEAGFDLIAHDEYERYPDYHDFTAEDDAKLAARHVNRVTDTGLKEQAAMTPIEKAVKRRWDQAARNGTRLFPHEVMFDILRSKELESQYQGDPEKNWLVAAAEKDIMIVVPGFEDSTIGNVFAAECMEGNYDPTLIRNGIEYMVELAKWYQRVSADHDLGFWQIGGGLSGDFAICVVPLLEQDAKVKGTKKWTYFCQMTDADESMGGYSGAMPNEKSSWGKLPPDAPMFNIKGDATINAPLLAAYVLGW